MIKNPQQRLALNGLVVSQGGGAVTHDGGFKLEALSTDSDFGDPEPIVSTLETELEDGERLQLDGYGNRELFFQVRVTAADAQGLALGEKALAGASRPGELSWLPPAVAGSETFYDVELCHLVWLWDDVDELRVTRVYGLRVTAQPFGRTAEPVVIPATGSGDPTPPPAPTETVIWKPGDGTAGWSTDGTGGLTSSPSHLSVTATANKASLVYSPDFAMGTNPMLAVNHYTLGEVVDPSSVWVKFAGSSSYVELTPIVTEGQWHYYDVGPGKTITEVYISAFFRSSSSSRNLYTKGIKTVSGMPYAGTARQMFRSFEVHGTARTSGTLRLSHTDALGSVLMWSGIAEGGYQPPMRRFKDSGGGDIADTAAASGARTDISASPFAITPPVSQLPSGLYRVAARVRSDTTGTAYFTRTYTTIGSPLAALPIRESVTASHDLSSTYRIVDLGTEMISGTPGESLSRRLTVKATGTGTGTVWLDELYLLNTSTGAVVQVEAGAATKLWVNAPTVGSPFPVLLGGTQASGVDAVRMESEATIFQPAAWPPGMINLFTVCGQPNLAAEAEYFPRFLHNAYEVAA